MRLIISRKGFDSGYGRIPSPIFPDGTFLSLPIPDASTRTSYADLHWGDRRVSDLLVELEAPIHPLGRAHLDPDLSAASRPRPADWRPAFGQEKSAQQHLVNNGVGQGDVFLFFGAFRKTELDSAGRLRFVRGAPVIHSLFGWLQIDEVLDIGENANAFLSTHPWLADHPHMQAHAAPGNAIYTARQKLDVPHLDRELPGAGVFRSWHDGLQLTEPGQSRTNWLLPDWFLPSEGPTMTYHKDPERWQRAGDGKVKLRAVAKGQEFIYVPPAAVFAAWLDRLFAGQ